MAAKLKHIFCVLVFIFLNIMDFTNSQNTNSASPSSDETIIWLDNYYNSHPHHPHKPKPPPPETDPPPPPVRRPEGLPEGINCTKEDSQQPCTTDMFGNLDRLYMYYNAILKDYIYTMNYADFGAGKDGYALVESTVQIWRYPTDKSSPIYAYYNQGIKKHFYTTNPTYGNEENGYKLQGLIGYILNRLETGTVPVYQFHDRVNQNHLYTPNFWVFIDRLNHNFDGVVGYACPIYI